VLCSLQDQLRTGMCDLDLPISCQKGDLQCTSLLDVLMVPSSTFTIATDGEHLSCRGFSLAKTVCLGNFEFIADYFGSLSLSPGRDNSGTAFMGSTRSGVSSPRWAITEDSTEEFLTAAPLSRYAT
jgi:hypothetical protein